MRGIYRILNKVNNKMYVGSTVDFDTRWREHKTGLVGGRHFNPYLQRAWDKYGEGNFVFEVVEEVVEEDTVLLACEQRYLDAWFPTGFLYNIATDAKAWMRGRVGKANPSYGKRHTVFSKQLMRESQERYWENNPHPWIGKHHTEESKQKNRESTIAYYASHDHPAKGKPKSKEHKAKLSIATIEWHKTHENPFKGRHHTEESNRKNSESNKEWYRTHKHPMLGKHHTEAAKRKAGEKNAQDYPDFYNELTEESIPSGHNLSRMCKEYKLNYANMLNLKTGETKLSNDGWRLGGRKDE